MIMHLFDARNVLGGDDARRALMPVSHPTIHDSAFDGNLYLSRPGLLPDGLQNLGANSRVISGRPLRVARKTHHRADEVGAADDADEPSIAHHWKALDAPAFH